MNKFTYSTLNKVKIDSACKVCSIYNENETFVKRLYDLGFVKNTKVVPLFRNISKSATAYFIKGSVIALRDIDAKSIVVYTV